MAQFQTRNFLIKILITSIKLQITLLVNWQRQLIKQNIPQKKNIFKKIWDRRLKKKIDDRVYGKFVHKTDSEISHVSDTNSIIMLNEISNKTTIC